MGKAFSSVAGVRTILSELSLIKIETTTFSGSTKAMITKDKNDEKVAHLEITKVVLVHFNIVSTNYQFNVRVLYKFVPNK